jgi:hypothetical protein
VRVNHGRVRMSFSTIASKAMLSKVNEVAESMERTVCRV